PSVVALLALAATAAPATSPATSAPSAIHVMRRMSGAGMREPIPLTNGRPIRPTDHQTSNSREISNENADARTPVHWHGHGRCRADTRAGWPAAEPAADGRRN